MRPHRDGSFSLLLTKRTAGKTKGEVVLVSRLRAALERLNPALPPEAITAAVDELNFRKERKRGQPIERFTFCLTYSPTFCTLLVARRKSDPMKLAIAARLRKETTLSIKAIAGRMHLGKSKGANTNLHKWMRAAESLAQTHLGL